MSNPSSPAKTGGRTLTEPYHSLSIWIGTAFSLMLGP